MTTKTHKAAKKEKQVKRATGRAAAIHALKAQGLEKAVAFERARKDFSVSQALFDRIWDRKKHGAKAEKVKKPATPAKKAANKKPVPARPSKPLPPPRVAAPTPVS